MRYLSLFSGIEAASAAWIPLGWECVGVAEIEKFPCAVLAHHYPGVPNLGDITKITQEQIAALGHIDLVVGGFPCQDLSVAGKRAGLTNDNDGSATQSGLFFTAMRVVGWTGARWTVIENVPGLFSSKQGADFASVVGALAGCEFGVPDKGWGKIGAAAGPDGLVEWCVLDAQWFGVPQRRRRVFLVRDTGDWHSRPPVLFERHSLQGHPAPSKEKREVTSTLTKEGTGVSRTGHHEDGWYLTAPKPSRMVAFGEYSDDGTASTMKARDYKDATDLVAQPICLMDQGGSVMNIENDMTGTLRRETHGHEPIVMQAMAVRRLTPTECERLQGFPDNYTDIKNKNKQTPDGPRYKALGNSMAVPVMRWIGERIQKVEALNVS